MRKYLLLVLIGLFCSAAFGQQMAGPIDEVRRGVEAAARFPRRARHPVRGDDRSGQGDV